MPLLILALFLASSAAFSQDTADGWVQQKCDAYAAAWKQALEAYGSDQMNHAFVAGNENFIAGGCIASAEVCPRSKQELEVANALTLALMNAGTASTFLPFRCPYASERAGGWSGPGL